MIKPSTVHPRQTYLSKKTVLWGDRLSRTRGTQVRISCLRLFVHVKLIRLLLIRCVCVTSGATGSPDHGSTMTILFFATSEAAKDTSQRLLFARIDIVMIKASTVHARQLIYLKKPFSGATGSPDPGALRRESLFYDLCVR